MPGAGGLKIFWISWTLSSFPNLFHLAFRKNMFRGCCFPAAIAGWRTWGSKDSNTAAGRQQVSANASKMLPQSGHILFLVSWHSWHFQTSSLFWIQWPAVIRDWSHLDPLCRDFMTQPIFQSWHWRSWGPPSALGVFFRGNFWNLCCPQTSQLQLQAFASLCGTKGLVR